MGKDNKILKTIYITLTFAMLLLPLLSMPFTSGASGAEKRKLAEMPKIIEDGKFNTEFTRKFDTYFSENFGFRPQLITAYSGLAYKAFGDSLNEKIITGKDGWLYFNETMNDYLGKAVLSQGDISRIYRSLYLQTEYLAGKGIKFVFAAAPNKNTIYPEHMPERYKKSSSESNLERLNDYLEGKRVKYINWQALLTENKGEQLLYHKKDTHWNNYGALLAYRETVRKAEELVPGIKGDYCTDASYTIERTWEGDLLTMLLPSSHEKDEQFVFDIGNEYNYIRPIRTLEDLLIETERKSKVNQNPADLDGGINLLMFRDSFANALIPFLSGQFDHALYSRALPFDYSLLNSAKPDLVVAEIAERNLPNLLLYAPAMPAPGRNDLNGEYETARDISAVLNISKEKAYTKIFGSIASDNTIDEITEIIVCFGNGNNVFCYEAFSLSPEAVKTSPQLKPDNAEYSLGFSMLVDENNLPEGTLSDSAAEFWILIKTGNKYIRVETSQTY